MCGQDKANAMIKHLARLAQDRLIIRFAPMKLEYSILKRIGELFPGPSKVMLQTTVSKLSYRWLIISWCLSCGSCILQQHVGSGVTVAQTVP